MTKGDTWRALAALDASPSAKADRVKGARLLSNQSKLRRQFNSLSDTRAHLKRQTASGKVDRFYERD